MNGIKPIETVYNGYRFRSRLEARWAVFFDTLGIPYEYEKEGYDLGEAGWYLPDFWLPTLKWWVEIKPAQEDHTDFLSKPSAFALLGGVNVVLFCGPPGLEEVNGLERVSFHGVVFIGDHTQLEDGTLLHFGHGAPLFERLAEFLNEPGAKAVLGKEHYLVMDYDGTEEIARHLIECDKLYYLQKYKRAHPKWQWGNCESGIAWNIYEHKPVLEVGHFIDNFDPLVKRAYTAARQARFEHRNT